MIARNLFDLTGKTVVVTGGSGVLGRVMCLGLAQAGARVVVLGRRLDACQLIVQEIMAQGGLAWAIAGDVTDRESLQEAALHIQVDIGPVNILVNGAGGNQAGGTTSPERSFLELDPVLTGNVFNLNFLGTFIASQVFGRDMIAREHGNIINITSMSGFRPLTRVAAYSAAKAAVGNFTQWLAVHMAQEYSPNIRVNALAPGFFLTEQNRFLLTSQTTGQWTERGEKIIAHTPMGRLGVAEDLVGTLLWLASPASEFVTGIVVPVDGGFSAYSGV
jgi:NAD(P)-dependent dehydrogenase (short-subunit alcohol dehydrogenase family)